MLPQKPRKLKILDLDTESRPLSYWGERPTAEITAIAWCFTDDLGSMSVRLLGVDDPVDMLQAFVTAYNKADIVTAHNIRRFDLPMINGNLIEYGLPKLTPKLTIDTYGDFIKRGDIPASQEYLLDLFGIGTKLHMGQHSWRIANRLLPAGIDKARQRVTGDVYDHMRLRPELQKHNLLRAPRMWNP